MQTLEIPLLKRSGKMVFYIISAFFYLFVIILLIGAILKNYGWWQLLIGGLLLIGLIISIKGLLEYYLYGNVSLVVESSEGKFKFYCLSSSGKKFLATKEYKLDEIGRIYGVQKTTRFLYKNYYYEIEGKSKFTKIFKEPVEVFPSLFEADEKGRDSVLAFIKSLNPQIEIGYQNYLQRKMN